MFMVCRFSKSGNPHVLTNEKLRKLGITFQTSELVDCWWGDQLKTLESTEALQLLLTCTLYITFWTTLQKNKNAPIMFWVGEEYEFLPVFAIP
jgi:hypothetical protein